MSSVLFALWKIRVFTAWTGMACVLWFCRIFWWVCISWVIFIFFIIIVRIIIIILILFLWFRLCIPLSLSQGFSFGSSTTFCLRFFIFIFIIILNPMICYAVLSLFITLLILFFFVASFLPNSGFTLTNLLL